MHWFNKEMTIRCFHPEADASIPFSSIEQNGLTSSIIAYMSAPHLCTRRGVVLYLVTAQLSQTTQHTRWLRKILHNSRIMNGQSSRSQIFSQPTRTKILHKQSRQKIFVCLLISIFQKIKYEVYLKQTTVPPRHQ